MSVASPPRTAKLSPTRKPTIANPVAAIAALPPPDGAVEEGERAQDQDDPDHRFGGSGGGRVERLGAPTDDVAEMERRDDCERERLEADQDCDPTMRVAVHVDPPSGVMRQRRSCRRRSG
jgi:hypothetical protein